MHCAESHLEEETTRPRTRTRSTDEAASATSIGEKEDLHNSFENSPEPDGSLALELDFGTVVGTSGSDANVQKKVEEDTQREPAPVSPAGTLQSYLGAGSHSTSSSAVDQFVQGLPNLSFMVNG